MAHRFRSLIRFRLAGRFDSDKLGYVSAFLSVRQRDIGTGNQQDQDEEEGQNEGRVAGEKTTKRRTMTVREIQEFTLPLVIHTNSPSYHQVANNDQFAHQIQFRQLDILRSLGQLIVLNANHCSDFMKIAPQIPCHLLKRLETLKYVQGSLEGNVELFLRRCRGLKDLDFASFHRDVFSWAVFEKQQRLEQQQQPRTPLQPTTATVTVTSLTTPQLFSTDLVQLRKLHLATSQWYVGRSMHSITFAFSHSLEDLLLNVYDHKLLRTVFCAHTLARLEASQTRDTPFQIDSCTLAMPRLKKLRLLRVNEGIVIGPAPFEGTEDPFVEGSGVGIGVASAYQIGSLQHSPLLETLVLVDPLPATFPPPPGDGGFGDIFSSTERPLGFSLCWTWTLNHLTKMHLAGQPAFHFRFEWIRRCPSLKTLTIDGLLPSTYLHHPDPADPQDHNSQGRLEDNIDNGIACGNHLHNCELIIYSRNRQLYQSRSALARVLETYCPNVTRLKLTGRPTAAAAAATTTETATATVTTSQEDSWEHIDLGTALFASKNLPHLTLLVSRIGSGPCLHTLTEQYSLVRGTNVVQRTTSTPARQGQTGVGAVVALWCRSIPFKDLQIEIEDRGGNGCSRFRQRASPASLW
ncbi:hypothetical protein KI688_002667 [Linnemannia hyalina]|uniref:Uncharacterized protein n=1 Tax=Linnemannia hyalina TaxID=64524 RepID=A0A9P7XQP7_9FUNG|nr:hypothetical protein KI688_002667 [Linnemannia hyalina]